MAKKQLEQFTQATDLEYTDWLHRSRAATDNKLQVTDVVDLVQADLFYDTLSELIAETDTEKVKAGKRVVTFANQNGAAVRQEWLIVDSTALPQDGGQSVALTGVSKFAEQVFGGYVLVEQYGAVADGATDSTSAFAAAMAMHGTVYGIMNTSGAAYVLDDLQPSSGQYFIGMGIDKTWIKTLTGTTSVKLLGKRFSGISHCTFVAQSTTNTIAIQMGQRGTAPLAADSQICQHLDFNNIRFVGYADANYMYASNTSKFDQMFYESCVNGVTIQPVGQVGGGGSAGNCNGNIFTACRAYGCTTAIQALTNLDGGNDAMHNVIDFYSEDHTGVAFNITGYDNHLNLYADTAGVGGTNYSVSGHNFFTPRDSANTVTQAQLKNNIAVYAKGNRMYFGAEFMQKQDVTLTTFGAGGGQITTNMITGNGDKCILRIQNTNGGGGGETLILNCMSDAPIGFELLLIHIANTDGFYLTEPASGGPWTKLNWPAAGGYAMAFSAYSRARIVKVDSTTLMYLNS